MDEEEGGYYSSNSNQEEEEEQLQKLKWNEQRARIFLLGREEDVNSLIHNLKSQKWYKSSVVDGQMSQVNFKYPVLGSKVFDLLPPNMLNRQQLNNNDSTSAVQQQQQLLPQQQRLQILTSKNTYYSLKKMKQSSRYNSLDSLEQLRIRSSNSGSSQSSLSQSQSQSLPGDVVNSNNFNAIIEEVKQFVQKQSQILSEQSQQNKAQLELVAKCLLQLVAQNGIISKGEDSNSNSNSNSNNKSNIIPSSEQQITASLLSLSSSCPQQQQSQSQQQQQQQQQSKSKMVQEEEESDYNDQKQTQQQHCLDKINDNNSSNSMRIFKRINELIGKLRVCSSYEDLEETLVNKEGFDFHEVMAVFVNNRHQIDTLIDIFKPKNNNSASQQQQTSQNVQQYQQNQQNQQQEIQYPSFIQQGHLFTTQEQQQKQQEVIEIEDEEKNNNTQELIQLQGIQNSNEINKPQMNVKNREGSISPLRRQQDAEQKSIDNNRKGYEQRVQKQMNYLANDPTSKPVRSKSPNNNNYSPNNNRPRSITPPQKNPKQ